jgi:hypothetical protein
MKQDIVLPGIKHNHQIRLQRIPLRDLVLKALNLLVQTIYNLHLAMRKDLISIGNRARNPFLKEVATLCEFRGFHDRGGVAVARADEEDQAPVVGDAFDDLGGAPEVCGGDFEGDDVDAGTHAVDVALVHGVPEGRCMAQVALGSQQQFEGNVFWARRVDEDLVRFVVPRDVGA